MRGPEASASRSAAELFADAAAELSAAGARSEALAEFVPPRRVWGLPRAATMRPLGRVWRLGVLLLSADARVFAVGETTRAIEQGRPNFQSVSAEERRGFRLAAVRGGFELGETVNFAARPIDLSMLDDGSAPLLVRDGVVVVRWVADAPVDAATPLGAYLVERVELLANPPSGA